MMTTGTLSKGMGSKGKVFLAAVAVMIGGLLAGTAQATVIQVTNEGGDGNNRNSFGYYIKGAGGIPTTGQILWSNTLDTSAPSGPATLTIDLDALGVTAAQIGYFLIPNGGGEINPFAQNGGALNPAINGTLGNGLAVVFFMDSGSTDFTNPWTVALDDGTTTGVFDSNDTALLGRQKGFEGAPAFFSDVALNPDGESHVLSGPLAGFGGNRHYEDLFISASSKLPGGSTDFNDANFTISVIPEPGTLVLFLFGLLGLGVFARRRAVPA